ncbi:MAG TPA: metal ABC transporter substrate-binding protein [Candidatus Kapabacteria bacterium]|nr:metal ABC transporter substrate-binding protein [Candidatus Kapabacteria bacterium]
MHRSALRFPISILLALLLFNCSAESTRPTIVVTSFPAASIIRELVGNSIDVDILVPSGASPHTYSPKPSDVKKSSYSLAFFSIADNLDGWSKNIKTKKHLQLINFLPDSLKLYFSEAHNHSHEGHNHDDGHTHNNSLDPHFWFDPIAVKAILNPLSDTLSKLLPSHSASIKKNAELFAKRLDLIHKEVSSLTRNLVAKPLFLQHPSILYFAKRYNLEYMGSIEETPGKEPSPKYISEMVKEIKESQATAIFTEPQLNRKAAEIIAKEAGVLLFELDPVGGTNEIKNYSDLIIHNAKILVKALGK